MNARNVIRYRRKELVFSVYSYYKLSALPVNWYSVN